MTPEEILKVEKDIVLTLKTIYDPEIPVNTKSTIRPTAQPTSA